MAQSRSSFNEASSSQTSDPYPYNKSRSHSITTSSALPPHINISSLPRGLPILGPAFGFNDDFRIKYIKARLIAFNGAVGRPLTTSEEQAVAWHTAKGVAILTWGPPVGVAAGLGRWWGTMREMRLLGFGKLNDETVNEKWKTYFEKGGEKPPWGPRWDNGRLWYGDIEMFKRANPVRTLAVVQGLRALPYISLMSLVSLLLTTTYGRTVTALGESADPRLDDVGKRLKEKDQMKIRDRTGNLPPASGSAERNRIESLGPRSQKRQIETLQAPRGDVQRGVGGRQSDDDASPTNGDDFFADNETEQPPTTMNPNEAKSQRQGGFQRISQDNPFDIPEQRGGFHQERYERQVPSSEASFDDASPTGGAGAIGNDEGESGGSVWERIRQSSLSGSSPGNQKNEGNGFAYSSNDEEKAYARSEAQKEFDARVEKERRGDFEGGKKW